MINELRRPYTRRAALVMATAAVASASLLAPADAASRSAAACTVVSDLFYDEVGQQIVAGRERVCAGDPEDNTTPLSTAITRDGVTVASGLGSAVYHCTDTELRIYRLRLTTLSVTARCS